jgi:hypothetical protein
MSPVPASYPTLRSVVLDATDARGLAEFYRQLLGYDYRPGDEPPPPGDPDPRGRDWLVLVDPAAGPAWPSSRSTGWRPPPGPTTACPSSCTWT